MVFQYVIHVDSQGLSKENIDSLYVGHLVLALL